MRHIFLLSIVLLAACDSRSTFSYKKKDPHVNSLNEIKANLAFTCVHEQFPTPSTEADVLFQYARWLQKNNQLKEDKSVDVEIERLYRIATENGHYKANINLQNGAMRGHFQLRGDEHLRLSERLISEGVATGYYFVGIFLQQGSAGLKQDSEMALRYFRAAADKGGGQAQYYVGDKLEPSDVAPNIALQMYRCAAEQGNGKAAIAAGVYLKNKKQYQVALETFQLGVAAGDETAAGWLEDAFRNPPRSDELNYLGQEEDLERAERYKKIWRILANYSYANPKVPEINDILPLPPAKLPAWDGKLKWLEERLANIPPEKPSTALINQLAKAMVLDPETGKPLPGSPSFSETNFLGPTCTSDEACPQSGYWKIAWSGHGGFYRLVERNTPRYFSQGEIMPMALVGFYQKRLWPLSEKYRQLHKDVTWGLLG
ncbi:sel1 repeat family protein [Pseudomonas sp. TNT3]|uniref:SEL1-like repeat protein n=1 Tax=Pseudomonas sp. TNT3 TaxID=2654097 RepID=UPI001391F971|nr:sel1 repeat family protein [Pseudomonas sp. TNT3]KAI2671131.1 sel1 repeat family protein [Pseudomonas sp. TNT3]